MVGREGQKERRKSMEATREVEKEDRNRNMSQWRLIVWKMRRWRVRGNARIEKCGKEEEEKETVILLEIRHRVKFKMESYLLCTHFNCPHIKHVSAAHHSIRTNSKSVSGL